MRVKFTMEGGIAYFPALSEPVLIDAEKLAAEDRDELQRRVEAAHFFDLPAKAGSVPRGAADYYTYVITVSAKGREHTIRVTDFVDDPEIKKLVNFLKAKAEVLREKK